MARQRVSLRALSDASGIPYRTLQKIRQGEHVLDVGELDRLAAALDTRGSRIQAAAERTVRAAEVDDEMYGDDDSGHGEDPDALGSEARGV